MRKLRKPLSWLLAVCMLFSLLPGTAQPLKGETGFHLTISGLHGGHSGCDINLGRASANQQMGRVLYSAMERFPGLRLADIRGGKFDNVICPRSEALAAVSSIATGVTVSVPIMDSPKV